MAKTKIVYELKSIQEQIAAYESGLKTFLDFDLKALDSLEHPRDIAQNLTNLKKMIDELDRWAYSSIRFSLYNQLTALIEKANKKRLFKSHSTEDASVYQNLLNTYNKCEHTYYYICDEMKPKFEAKAEKLMHMIMQDVLYCALDENYNILCIPNEIKFTNTMDYFGIPVNFDKSNLIDLQLNTATINDKTEFSVDISKMLRPDLSEIKQFFIGLSYKIESLFSRVSARTYLKKGLLICIEAKMQLPYTKDVNESSLEVVLKKLQEARIYFVKSNFNEYIKECDRNIENILLAQQIANYKTAYTKKQYADNLFAEKDFKAAYKFYKQANELYKMLNDKGLIEFSETKISESYSLWQIQEGNKCIDVAMEQAKKENFSEAFKKLYEAKEIFKKVSYNNGIRTCDEKIEYCKQAKQQMIIRCNKEGDAICATASQAIANKQYSTALNNYKDAITIYTKAENQAKVAECRKQINFCYVCLGDIQFNLAIASMKNNSYSDAIEAFKRASTLYHNGNDNAKIQTCNAKIKECFLLWADAEFEQGVTRMSYNAFNVAIDNFENGIQYYRSSGHFEHVDKCESKIAKCNVGLGHIAYNEGLSSIKSTAYQYAIKKFQSAQDFYKKGKSTENVMRCSEQIKLCNAYIGNDIYKRAERSMNCKDYKEAIRIFKSAIDYYVISENKTLLDNAYNAIKTCYARLGDKEYEDAQDEMNREHFSTATELLGKALAYYQQAGDPNLITKVNIAFKKCKDLEEELYERERQEQQDEWDREEEERQRRLELGTQQFEDGIYYMNQGDYQRARWKFLDAEENGVTSCNGYSKDSGDYIRDCEKEINGY